MKKKPFSTLSLYLVCAAAGFFSACGGGGGSIINPTPTLDSIAVTTASSSFMVGGTDQMTAMGTYSDGSTQNLTNSATTTWSSSNAKVATISAAGLVTGVAAGTATFTATSGTITGTSTMVTVNQPATITSVKVSCNPTTISGGAISKFSATVTGTGDFDPTVTWKSSNTAVATVTSTGKDTADVTGLTATSTAQVTITATSKDPTKSGTATIIVLRTITIAVYQPFPWNQIYSKYGYLLGYSLTCSGCMAGDTLYSTDLDKAYVITTLTSPTTSIPLLQAFLGNQNVPEPFKDWIVGSDGAQSNILWFLYRGSQNVAVQSAASGEIYYYYSGDETANAQGCYSSVLLFKSDGTPDGSIPCIPMANSFAIDDSNQYLILIGAVLSGKSGAAFYDLNNLNMVGGGPIAVNGVPLSDASTQIFAVATSGGNSCYVAPEAGTLFCVKDSPNTQKPQPPVITITGLNDPMALVMPDASHVVVYCTGDQTLHWYTFDGVAGTAVPSDTLTLQGFTNTDASFWNNHVTVGGWFIVQVGSTLGVMGQVVNTDGTVDQELALVDNASQKQIGTNYKLPGGTVLITPDPANNAIAIQYPQYPDVTSGAPITNFARLYVDTGNMVDLTSTSTLTPSVAFLVLQNGEIFTGVLGQIALEPNQ